ncbi:MAG: hypothetical protein JKY23_04280 [Nitrospinaceae bacterium]|nr:hypothetical protein [Nitrospinaceae bacterium]
MVTNAVTTTSESLKLCPPEVVDPQVGVQRAKSSGEGGRLFDMSTFRLLSVLVDHSCPRVQPVPIQGAETWGRLAGNFAEVGKVKVFQ